MKVLEPLILQSGVDYSTLRETLSTDLSREMEYLHQQLKHDLEQRLAVQEMTDSPACVNEVSHLIHTITDTKLHQMQLELRQHLNAKLDVLLEDVKEDQLALERRLERRILQEMDKQLIASSSQRKAGMMNRLVQMIPAPDLAVLVNVPLGLTIVIILIMFIVWPA